MIHQESLEGGHRFVSHVGGAVFNTAIALGRLDASVVLLSGVSSDLFGQQIKQALTHSQVDCQHLIISDRPTTLAFVQLDNGNANYTFYDENSAGRLLAINNLPKIDDSVSAAYFGGISLACEPCGDVYSYLAESLATDKVVMLDPNIRQAFIADETRYRDRLQRLISIADIIKVSDEDLHWIIPEAATLQEKALALKAQGAAIVIVTQGAEGATAYFGEGDEVTVPAKPAVVVDTIGAGDTFNAGFLSYLADSDLLAKSVLQDLSKEYLQAALSFAAEAASIVVSRAGANAPWRSELS